MGLKAGLHLLQNVIKNYTDDAARLATQSGDNVARAVATKTDDAISVFGKKADDVVGVFDQNIDDFVKTGKATATPQLSHASAIASHSVDEAGNVVLKEHGFSEIMKETVHTPTPIGQTPVHSPIRQSLPEHYVEFEGQFFEYPTMTSWDLKLQKMVTTKATHYEITQAKDGINYQIKFYSDTGYLIGTKKCLRASKMSKQEMEQIIEELKKRPKGQNPTSTTPVETWVEKTIKSLAEPKGAASRRIILDEDGNTIVRFLDDKDSLIRKVKIDPNGRVLEYTNFRTMFSNQGISNANLTRRGLSSYFKGEMEPDAIPYVEEMSTYMRVREQSRYILDFDGNVTRSIQTRRFTPHIKGKIGETPTIVEIDTRSMSDGRFVEDVILTRGDKRFSRSFWFDQKTGSVLHTDGWCKGLTKEELELIKSDPYLASRYIGDGLDFVRTEKFNAFKTQGLRDKQTPLTFNVPDNPNEMGHYWHYGLARHINITPATAVNGLRGRVVNTLHHEPRHGFQFQMVDDLNADLLQNGERVQAEIFAENFRNYKKPEIHGHEAYSSQPVEVDARHYGEIAQRQFEEIGEKIDRIFFDI